MWFGSREGLRWEPYSTSIRRSEVPSHINHLFSSSCLLFFTIAVEIGSARVVTQSWALTTPHKHYGNGFTKWQEPSTTGFRGIAFQGKATRRSARLNRWALFLSSYLPRMQSKMLLRKLAEVLLQVVSQMRGLRCRVVHYHVARRFLGGGSRAPVDPPARPAGQLPSVPSSTAPPVPMTTTTTNEPLQATMHTFEHVFRDWYVGGGPEKPSVVKLEEDFKTAWRQGSQMRSRFRSRERVITFRLSRSLERSKIQGGFTMYQRPLFSFFISSLLLLNEFWLWLWLWLWS